MLKHVYQNWNDKLFTLCTFVDFSRAFDSIDHAILIRKLKLYGFDNISISFMQSYLNSRWQYTVVGDCKSVNSKVTYGTAQGSILGPLIYILYANDVFQELPKSKTIIMYADDTLLLSTGTTLAECIKNGQNVLDTLVTWCDLNKLTINVKKKKSMLIKSNAENVNLNLYIHDTKLDFVSRFEHLGIHIDKTLGMNNHIDSVYRKCMTKLVMLYKIRNFISRDIALLIYKTMIRPYMDYGDFMIDSAHSSKIEKLERLQDRIVCLIEYCPVKENRMEISRLLLSYNIESLKTRRKKNLLCLMYDQSRENMNVLDTCCNINLRSSSKIKLKSRFTRLTKVQKSPYYRGLVLWNNLPDTLQTESCKTKFKRNIKRYNFK